uniref:Uncharacterized protein n=1 Tax=Varanus komodoensis TaxID=61221 RepID=A0A8D2L3R8_VARKO
MLSIALISAQEKDLEHLSNLVGKPSENHPFYNSRLFRSCARQNTPLQSTPSGL